MQKNSNNISGSLSLGGLYFTVKNKAFTKIIIEDPYSNFINTATANPDYEIHIVNKIPDSDLSPGKRIQIPVFTKLPSGRCIQKNLTWQILIYPEFTIFETPHPDNQHSLTMRVSNNADDKIIYLASTASTLPLLPYPLDILLLYHIGQWHDYLILHGAGFNLNDYGYLCLGRSGSGKSTLSQLIQQNKGIVIQDDRIILQKKADKWIMHPVPLKASDKPSVIKLNKIYSLSHGHKNYSVAMYGTNRLKWLLPHLIQFPAWEQAYSSNISLVRQLLDQVSIGRLFFKPDKSIINYLQYVNTPGSTPYIPVTKPMPGKIQSYR